MSFIKRLWDSMACPSDEELERMIEAMDDVNEAREDRHQRIVQDSLKGKLTLWQYIKRLLHG